ncbi:hypothetical protein L596_016234 [Steinernema carpocapsae]|uniref:Uncharacterized protein n=1 Tax=Steinernema carpocapsae TaxID=34508 RepID=A0A4U5NHH4_STECR|nr:hypothetical protein L596_016234 [Steinernema carpocapsae]
MIARMHRKVAWLSCALGMTLKMRVLVFLVLFAFCGAFSQRLYYPPPASHLKMDRSCVQSDDVKHDSRFDCRGAKFQVSRGFFQPCSQHAHCYDSREPSDWCVMAPEFMWTNWGCHCDKKLGSCIIERFNRRSQEMQWAFCTPKREFYCESRQYQWMRPKQ